MKNEEIKDIWKKMESTANYSKEELENIVFIAADANEHPQAYQYGVSSVPTLLFFKGEEVLGQNVGFVPEQPLQDFLKKLENGEPVN